jgi:hypothetical protein
VAIIDVDPSQGRDSHFWPRERILDYASSAGYEKTKLVDDISRHLIIVLKPRVTSGEIRRRPPTPPVFAIRLPSSARVIGDDPA